MISRIKARIIRLSLLLVLVITLGMLMGVLPGFTEGKRDIKTVEAISLGSKTVNGVTYMLYTNNPLALGWAEVVAYDNSKETLKLEDSIDLNGISGRIVVSAINADAFKNADKLKEITLPLYLDAMYPNAFENCVNLQKITFTSNNIINYNFSFKNAGTKTDGLTVTVGTDVRRLPNNLFYSASTGEAVKIKYLDIGGGGNSLEIGDSAFKNTGVKSNSGSNELTIPSRVNRINASAFENSKITELVLEAPNLTLGEGAFANSSDLATVKCLQNTPDLPKNLFRNCPLLNQVTIPGVTNVGESAFYECIGLEKINFQDSIVTVRAHAFEKCYKLKITSLASVKTVGEMAFKTCKSIQTLTLPATLDGMDKSAFEAMESLTSFVIDPNAPIKSFPINAFLYNRALKEIVLPNNLQSISDGAFRECINLIVKSPLTTPPSLGINSFGGVKAILVNEARRSVYQSNWSSYASIIFNTNYYMPAAYSIINNTVSNAWEYLLYTGNATSFNLNEPSITKICEGAFSGNTTLQALTLTGSVNTVEKNAFGDNLKTLYGNVYYAAKWAVGFVGNAEEITLRSDTAGIANSAFANAANLKKINIPSSVNYIGESAFAGCTRLERINIYHKAGDAVVTLNNSNAIPNNSGLKIYVTESSLTNYKNATNWKTHETKIVVNEGGIINSGGLVDGGYYQELDLELSFIDLVPASISINGVSQQLPEPGEPFSKIITAEGSYTLVIKDTALNEYQYVFVIDKTPPTVTGVNEGGTHFMPVLNFGDSSSGVTGALISGGTLSDYAVAGGTKLTSNIFADGEYTLTVTDLAGNKKTVTFMLNNTPVIKFGANSASANKVLTDGTWIADSIVYFAIDNYDFSANNAVVRFVNANSVSEDQTGRNGFQLTLTNCRYEVTVSGEGFNTVKVFFYVDSEAPKITNNATGAVILDGEYNTIGMTALTVRFTDNATNKTYYPDLTVSSIVYILVKNQTTGIEYLYQANSEEFNKVLANGIRLTESGKYLFVVSDLAGRTNQIDCSFYFDAPSVSGAEQGMFYSGDVKFTVDDVIGNTPKNISSVTVNGTVVASQYWADGYTVSEPGEYTVITTDKYGHSRSVVFYIDVTAPQILSPEDGSSHSGNAGVLINVTDNLIDKNSIAYITLRDSTNNIFYIENGDRFRKPGTYTLTVYDRAGNFSEIEFTVFAVAVINGDDSGKEFFRTAIVTFENPDGDLTAQFKKDNGGWTAFNSGNIFDTEGSYTVVIMKNAVEVDRRSFTIDRTNPQLAGTISQTESEPTIYREFEFTANDKHYSHTEIYFKDTGYALYSTEYTNIILRDNVTDGLYKIVVYDLAGNETLYYVYIDNTAPVVTGVVNGGMYIAPRITVADANFFEVTLNGVAFSSGTTLDSSGFEDGEYVLVATDELGNSVTLTFTLCNSNSVTYANSNSTTRLLADGALTNADSLVIYFLNHVSEPVVLVDGNEPPVLADEAIGGFWINYGSISEGVHVISINGTEFSLTVDRTAPEIFDVVNDMVYSDVNMHFLDASTGLASVVLYNKTTKTTTNISASESGYAISKSEANNGEYSLTVTDKAGNVSVVNFVMLCSAPKISGIGSGGYSFGTVTLTITDCIGGSRLYSVTANSQTQENKNTFSASNEGRYSITVVDSAGNSLTFIFYIDRTNPVITLPDGGPTYNSVKLNFSDMAGTAAGAIGSAKLQKLGGNTVDVTNGQVINTDGTYTLTVIDRAGNKTEVAFTVYTGLPQVTGVANGGYYKNASVTIYMSDTIEIRSATLNGSAVDISTLSVTSEGTYTLVVTNIAGGVTTVVFTIDRTAPVIDALAEGGSYEDFIELYFSDGGGIDSAVLNDGSTNTDVASGQAISTAGNYTLTVTDKAGNITTVSFSIWIDANPPEGVLTGAVRGGISKGIAKLTWSKAGATATISFNNETAVNYIAGTEVSKSGKYVITLTSASGLYSVYEFTLDNEVLFSANILNGAVTNSFVVMHNLEAAGLDLVLTRNGAVVSYVFDTNITADGAYIASFTDSYGNTASFAFTIITKPTNGFSYTCPEGYEFAKFTKNGANVALTPGQKVIDLNEDAVYEIEVVSIANPQEKYTYKVTIDTIPPQLTFSNLNSSNLANNTVVLRASSKALASITVFKDGVEIEGSLGMTFRTNGTYKIIAVDESGNVSEFEFRVEKSISPLSLIIGVVLGGGAVGGLTYFGFVRRKKRFNTV